MNESIKKCRKQVKFVDNGPVLITYARFVV